MLACLAVDRGNAGGLVVVLGSCIAEYLHGGCRDGGGNTGSDDDWLDQFFAAGVGNDFLAVFAWRPWRAFATWFCSVTWFAWLAHFTRLAHLARFAWFTRRARGACCRSGGVGEGGNDRCCLGTVFTAGFIPVTTTATTAAATTGVACVLVIAVGFLFRLDDHDRGNDDGGFRFLEEESHQLGHEAFFDDRCRCRCGDWLDGFDDLALDDRCRLVWRDALDDGFLTRLGFFLLALAVADVGLGFLGHCVAGLDFFEAGIVVLDALELVVRGFKVLVRDHDDRDPMTGFDFQDFAALFIEQERSDIDRGLDVDRGRIFLHCFFLDDAQDLQGGRFGIADVAGAIATRASDVTAFGQRRTQALTRQFHQAETRDFAHLDAGTVEVQCIFQAGFDFTLVLCVFHVNEVDDDQATEVAQAQLAGNFFGGFAIGIESSGFDVATAGGARRVDVDRDQRFGVVDDDRAAGRQRHGARVRGFNLVFDLEAREQRHVIAVALDPVDHVRHHVAHELLGLFVDVVGIDQDFADVGLEIIADGADHERRFLIDQEGACR